MPSIDGRLNHPAAAGDGVVASIVSSRQGLAGQWTLRKAAAATTPGPIEVEAGDTIDFVVDALESNDADATEFQPDLQHGIMRMERQSLARQRNAVRLVGGIAVVDNHLRGAAG